MRPSIRCPCAGSLFRTVWAFLVFGALTSASTSQPTPISVTFDNQFRGYDGKWSPAQIRVGSPEQWLTVLPNTVMSETWVIGPDGCNGGLTCRDLRGGLFFSNTSSTWSSLNLFELGYSNLLGETDYGYYGLDSLSVSDNLIVPNQTVAIINNTNYWLGQLGLGAAEARFQSDVKQPSFLSSLVQNASAIPSHSYGYTAGAYYKDKSTLGSLTLGGVDTTRYVPNDVSFTLAPGYLPVLAVNSIIVSSSPPLASTDLPSNWNSNPLTLMDPKYTASFTIDSSTPFLWLPTAICDNIASALNLTYDNSLQLYLYANGTDPTTLAEWGLTFTFSLANSRNAAETIDLTISYDAFNHQLSYPFPGLYSSYESSVLNYFPLRRANRTDQYTIGRMFLQETYLTVDYERNNFSLSQAVFPDTAVILPNIVSILRPSNSTWPGPKESGPSGGLSTGAKAGIGVGAAVAVLVNIAIIWCFCIRKRTGSESMSEKSSLRRRFFGFSSSNTISHSSTSEPAELLADRRHPSEMTADITNSRFELPTSPPVEMAAADVSPKFFQTNGINTISRNDPRNPAEILPPENRNSIRKDPIPKDDKRTSDPSPDYTPQDIVAVRDRHDSNSVSPYSVRHPNAFRTGTDTTSSGEQGISPIAHGGSEKDGQNSGSNTYSSSSGRARPSPVSPITPRDHNSMMLPRPAVFNSNEQSAPPRLPTRSTSSISERNSHDRLSRIPSNSQNLPERSASRSSRFTEDFTEVTGMQNSTPNENIHGQQPPSIPEGTEPQRPQVVRARFSWED